MEIRKICVACTNANGEPDIFFFKLGMYSLEEDYDAELDDYPYEAIKGIAEENDYEGPYVIWDETDYLFRNLDCESKFEWDSASIILHQSDFRAGN
jgi:hypothetical protein